MEKTRKIALASDSSGINNEPGIPGQPLRNLNWQRVLFYVGVPAAIALYAALNNWAVLQVAGYTGTLAFYAGHAFIPWWSSCLMTRLGMEVLRPWKPGQMWLLLTGSLASCIVMLPYSMWMTEQFAGGWLIDDPVGFRASLHIHGEVGFWSFALRATLIWIGVNWVFDRFLGLPRYRYDFIPAVVEDAPDAGDSSDAQLVSGGLPRFLHRLGNDIEPEAVIALKAEQHYVKVFTAERSFMTLYRFSDAVAEMGPEVGQQVHRSYWVRNDAIERVRRRAKKLELELPNDLKIPVSSPNVGLIRQLAQANGIPMVPPI